MAGLLSKAAAKGRRGDDTVGHLDSGEKVVHPQVMAANPGLEALIDDAIRRAGGKPGRYTVGGKDDSRNPRTGMREFAWNEESQTDDGTSRDGYSGDEGGYGNDRGGDQGAGRGFQGSPEHGPHHAETVNAAFDGDKRAGDTAGLGPEEIGGGLISAFGVSPAENYNPMTGKTEYGVGFNAGKALLGGLGTIFGGPAAGAAGSWIGGKLTDTSFHFPGYGSTPQAQPGRAPREGDFNGQYVYDAATGRIVFMPT